MVNKKVENRFFINKKAQGLSVNTIILIVLGLVVLVVLILGFTMGWGNIKNWIIPSNNVASIADSCRIVCGTDQKYNYCFEKRELKSKEETLIDVTCYTLSKKKPVYGIADCPAIECGIYDDENKAKTACSEIGKEVMYLDGTKVASYTCLVTDITPAPSTP